MKEIPETYTQTNYTLRLIERTEDYALYHQTGETYEVIRIRWKSQKNEFDPGGFRLPSPEEWGNYGWTCNTLKRAREVMQNKQAVYDTYRRRRSMGQ